MGEGVVTDLVAVRQLAADEVGVAQRLAPQQEEGARHAVAAQDVEDARRPDGVRAVVEREGHRARGHADAGHRAGVRTDHRTARPDRGRHLAGGARRPDVSGVGQLTRDVAVQTERHGHRDQNDDERQPVRPRGGPAARVTHAFGPSRPHRRGLAARPPGGNPYRDGRRGAGRRPGHRHRHGGDDRRQHGRCDRRKRHGQRRRGWAAGRRSSGGGGRGGGCRRVPDAAGPGAVVAPGAGVPDPRGAGAVVPVVPVLPLPAAHRLQQHRRWQVRVLRAPRPRPLRTPPVPALPAPDPSTRRATARGATVGRGRSAGSWARASPGSGSRSPGLMGPPARLKPSSRT